jgi:hypothetical protein
MNGRSRLFKPAMGLGGREAGLDEILKRQGTDDTELPRLGFGELLGPLSGPPKKYQKKD